MKFREYISESRYKNLKYKNYQAQALKFEEKPIDMKWNVPNSTYISKLWIRDNDKKEVVYNWDRGAHIDNIPAKDLEMIIKMFNQGKGK